VSECLQSKLRRIVDALVRAFTIAQRMQTLDVKS
jgi:hypothetical protein